MNVPLCVSSHDGLIKWLANHDIDLAYDVGANDGGYTAFMRNRGVRRVIAFEPLPEYAERLRLRFLNDHNVQVMQVGISDHEHSQRNLSVLNCWTLANQDTTTLDPSPSHLQKYYDVEFVKLDDLRGNPKVVKIDVDGFEPMVIKGMTYLITRCRPLLMLELSYLPTVLGYSCDQMIRDLYVLHKYKLVSMDGKYICHSWNEAMAQFPWNTSYDVLCIPEEEVGFYA